jgi:hypothetical protein
MKLRLRALIQRPLLRRSSRAGPRLTTYRLTTSRFTASAFTASLWAASLVAACIAAASIVLAPVTAFAREPTEPVELTVWNRSFKGTIGEKTIEILTLGRIGAQLRGRYCYGVCGAERPSLALQGRWDRDILTLEESVPGAADDRIVTGRWRLQAQGQQWRGEWRSADGKHRLPVALSETTLSGFADELRVLAEHAPGSEKDTCDSQSPPVSEIRIYRNDRLRQMLPTDSVGTCGMFLPELVDANFDGRPDLSIALMLPAGPNIPHQMWLYDPKQDRFVDAPASLQEITSPMFDAERKRVYNYWRGSCCSHGVDVYRWNDGELERIAGAESHFMPVKRGGKLGYVYTTPSYENGKIVFSPRVEQDAKGRLRLVAFADSDLDSENGPLAWSEALKVDVYAAAADGGYALKSSQAMRWRALGKGEAKRWCPDLAYFDLDRRRIERQRIEDPDVCTNSDPTQ